MLEEREMLLKPCPFCAEPKTLNLHYPDEHGHYVIWCGNCGAFGPNDISYDKTVEMWNLRRPVREPKEYWHTMPELDD